MDFLGRTIPSAVVKLQRHGSYISSKLQNFRNSKKHCGDTRDLRTIIEFNSGGSQKNYRHFPVRVTPDLLQNFTGINKALDQFCELSLKQPLPNKLSAMMIGAGFMTSSFAVPIEDDQVQTSISTRIKRKSEKKKSSTFTYGRVRLRYIIQLHNCLLSWQKLYCLTLFVLFGTL